ncbi:DUF4062 domain-containing protein [bacterium]|nr:DUF4062 domain-containing protein [bacterium]
MEKRYQVFVSSTYADLKEERQHVTQALIEMDCIPAGMELFPATDEEQWEFIKRIIDDCDYYLLIIGGRYGSTTDEGISYTEKEYDYAVENGLKVIALLHEKPDEIPVGKSDMAPELREKLQAFRGKVSDKRLVKFWTNATELPSLVTLSLSKTIKMFPAIGWVRASAIKSINGVSVQSISSDRHNFYSYLLKRVKAKQTWDILTFSGYNKHLNIWPEKKDYQKAMLNSVNKNKNLVVRRNVAICNEDHLSHLIVRMKEYQGKNYLVEGFLKKEQSVPMFNIIIIDKEEVILWLKQEPGVVSSGTDGCISIKHPHVAEKFHQYYLEVWNRNSDYFLKDENSIYEDSIKNLRARL